MPSSVESASGVALIAIIAASRKFPPVKVDAMFTLSDVYVAACMSLSGLIWLSHKDSQTVEGFVHV